MDLSDFDSSLLVWEEADVAEKAIIKNDSEFIVPEQDLVDSSADTIEQVTLALLNGDTTNNANLMPLLNNFVSAMADQSMASVALGTLGEGSFHYPYYGSSGSLLSPQMQPSLPLTQLTALEADNRNEYNLSLHPLALEPTQISGKLPQHLMINQNSSLKDGYNIHATTDADGRTHLQPIFPPNFFLPPGTLPWDPSAHGPSLKTTFNITERTPNLFHSSINNPSFAQQTSLTQFVAPEETHHTLTQPFYNNKIVSLNFADSNLLPTHHLLQPPPPDHSRSKITRKCSSERNEREQRRAAQITELIDELRESMVKAGWKVELKGKYHTLSRCAEYLQHLKTVTKDKEDAIERAKRDISIKRQKIDEDKSLLESRSDPESVISSLTASSCDDNQGLTDTVKKRRSDHDSIGNNHYTSKKISFESGSGSSSSNGRPNVSIENMCSSISDITDKSVKSSINEPSPSQYDLTTSSKSGAVDHELDSFKSSVEHASSSSISSTAAVVSGVGSNDRQGRHVDILMKGSDQRLKRSSNVELSSQHKNFVLDFEEVFRTSNVPQLIAAPSGRVIACNDFFLKSMGLQTIYNLTLFSFVHPDKLADLFELIAMQLRHNHSEVHEVPNQGCKYESITLPCIQLQSYKSGIGRELNTPMFMHVTLLSEEDPRKRCIHCILTDIPGTEGKIGYVSIDMLSRMFSKSSA